jgi:hypothetical protein
VTIHLRRSGESTLEIVTATPTAGFAAEIEVQTGREVEADFRGNGERHQFNAELEDGSVRVRIRTVADENTGGTAPNASTVSTSTTQTSAATSTSAGAGGNLNLTSGQTVEIPVGEAGVVVLARTDTGLQIVNTRTNAGWAVEVEVASGREVEGDFRNGTLRIKFNFELEDGVVRVRIENDSDDNGSGPSGSGPSGSSNGTASASTTVGANAGVNLGPVTYDLNGAGSVTVIVTNGSLSIQAISPTAGWSVAKSEGHSDEVEVELANGDQEVELKVKLELGQLRVEIERKN